MLAAIWLAGDVERYMNTPMNVPDGGHRLTAARGDTLTGIAERLAADAILGRPSYLIWHARWYGRDRDARSDGAR